MEIAVVGIGCRLPGAENSEEFWGVLTNKEDHITDIPEERWQRTNKLRAGIIRGSESVWDHELHGVSSYEGREMDPQQKMVLDTVYMALENAGITKKQIHGSNTSVFIGAMNNDYKGLLDVETDEGSNYQVTGSSSSILSARVSYIFNLLGTSVTVDSACSSSAVAIDLACNQLKSGNCEMAIAGGVNSILSPGVFSQLLKAGMLSPSGICHAFSDKADGYVRGEGCGIVILKPLTKALNDQDRILATIITATNQDGATVSPITAPSVQQQVVLMEKIYGEYGISPDTVDYVEAHGTGTKVGDPIEIKGLDQFFKRSKSNQSLPIGSVKTNIGHLESASGVASLIKVILMHQHQTLVPTLHYDRPNKAVPLSEYNLEVVTDVRPWPSNNRKYIRSAVNCFGFGGTNCHMIVTTHLSSTSSDQRENANSNPTIVCLSAKNPVSLERMVEDLCKDRSDYTLDDLSYTSIKRRNHYKYRKSVVGRTVKEVLQNLKQYSSESDTKISQKKKVIMVFAGVGTSWQGMCRKLLTNSNIFQSKIVEIQTFLQKHEKWDLMKKLSVNNEEDFFNPSVNPILIFAVEVALFHTLTEVGIIPDAILGQSMGEVAAAVASGVLQLEQAVDIIYYRTKCLKGATGGHMFLVRGIPEDKVVSVLKHFDSRACIALYYSPVSFVVSCDADLSTAIKSKLLEEEANIFFTDLKVPSAFHSHHMNDAAQRLKDILDFDINESPSVVPIYSTVTGALVKGDEFISPNYWAKNVRHPVLFHQAVLSSYDPDKINIYLEVGPKPVLKTFLGEIFNLQESVIGIPTVNAGDDLEHVLKSITRLYNLGIDIEWKDFLNPIGQLIDEPRYQFDPKSYRFCRSFQYQKLMGVKTTDHRHRFVRPTMDDHLTFKILLDQSEIPSMFTHKVHENNIIPGALFAEAGLAIWSLINDFYFMEPCEVSVRFLKPVTLNDKNMKMLDVSVDNSDVKTFTVSDGQIQCAVGKIQPSNSKVKTLHLDDIKNRCRDKIVPDVFYGNLKRKGFKYGKKIALLGNCVRNSYEALTEMNITDLKDELNKTILHPAIIDSLIQTACAFIDNYTSTDTELYPVKISRLVVSRSPSEHMLIYTKLLKEDNHSLSFSVDLCLRNGLVVASIQEVLFRLVHFSHSTLKRFQMFSWKKLDDSKFDSASTMHMEMTTNDQSPSFLAFVADSERNRINEQNIFFISTDEELRQNQLSDFESMTSPSSVVVIPPNYTIDDILMTGKGLEECIEDIMLWLKDLFLFITEDLHASKVVVLMLNTWTKVNETKLSRFTSTNPIQRAVLGFLRSVQKEVPFHLHIVDTDEASPTIDSIWNLLLKLASVELESETEFILKQTNLFVCRCEPKDEDDDCLEIKTIRPRTDIELFVDEYDRDFVMYCRRPLKDIKDSQMLKVSTLVFPKTDLFSSHIYHELDGEKTIFSRFFLEAVGRIDSEASHTEVVSCYPVVGSDIVRVPKVCCWPLEMFHGHYIPGMMTILVILWNLARKVKKSDVAILYSDKSEAKVVDLLCSMLAPANVIPCTISQMKDQSSIKIDQIISLVRMSNQCILDILECFQNVDDIVTLSALVPDEIQSRFCYNSVNAKMLTDHDMFKPLRLTALLPELFRWLATTRQDTFEDMKNYMCEESTPFLGLVQVEQVDVLSEVSTAPLRLIPGRIISRQGLYIVVGGLTGLGWECVKWLAKAKAAVIVCFNRRVPSSEDTRKMNDLYSKHLCKVVAFSTDVTNLETLNDSMLKLKKQFPDNPIRGVLYGAAVSGDAMMSSIHRQQIQSVLAPKVRGTWNIHKVTQNEDLDFFILHSSITAVLGNAGQTVYGSANAFMDGLVDLRRSIGLPAQAINWGPLDMGMLESETTRRRFFDQGFNLITKEEIGTCLEKAIISNQPQIIVAHLTNKILEADIYTKSKLKDQVASQLHSARPKSGNDEFETNRMIDLNALRDTPKDKRLEVIQRIVLNVAQTTLGTSVTLENNLHGIGIDSMTATAIRNQIYKITNYNISLPLLNSSTATLYIISQNINYNMFLGDTDYDIRGENQSSRLTYMEHRYLKLNEITKAHKSLNTVVDFNLRNLEINFQKFIEIVTMVLERNEYARTTFIGNLNGAEEDIKKVVIESSQAADVYDINNASEEDIEQLKMNKFDLSSKGTVRFLLESKENVTRIIIITHDICFDKKTFAFFLEEFIQVLIYFLSKEEFKLPNQIQKPIKTAFEILESALEKKGKELVLFWKAQLKQGIPDVSIDPCTSQKIDSGLYVVRHQQLPKDLYRSLKSVSGNTVTKIIITMYQLLLGYKSSSRRVCVILPQDVRIPIPELTDHLGCLTNNVPLFVDIPDDGVSITEFLKFNSKSIIECTDYNGFFPFERLADLFPEGTPENSLNLLGRHWVTYNDRSFTNKHAKAAIEHDVDLQLKQVENVHLYCESDLYINENATTGSMDLTLHLTQDMYDEKKAEEVLNNLVAMLEVDINSSTIGDLRQIVSI